MDWLSLISKISSTSLALDHTINFLSFNTRFLCNFKFRLALGIFFFEIPYLISIIHIFSDLYTVAVWWHIETKFDIMSYLVPSRCFSYPLRHEMLELAFLLGPIIIVSIASMSTFWLHNSKLKKFILILTLRSVIFWRLWPSIMEVIVDVAILSTFFPLSVSASATAPK